MTSQVQIILYFFGPIHSAGEYYPALCPSLSLSSISSSANAVRRAVVADDALAAESLDKDEVPQDLIDMTARAADDTGRMVRSHPTSGLTPDKKRQRTAMADLAERFERESDEWHKRYEDLDAQVAKRVGSKDWSRYPSLIVISFKSFITSLRTRPVLQRSFREISVTLIMNTLKFLLLLPLLLTLTTLTPSPLITN